MGLTWSSPKEVKNRTLIVISSNFPENKKVQEQFWNLWKLKKDMIKSDGFNISKDKNDNQWKINYFHTINETSYEKTKSGEHTWKVEFLSKVRKWEDSLTQVKNFMSDKVEEDVLKESPKSVAPKSVAPKKTYKKETIKDPFDEPANRTMERGPQNTSRPVLEYENNDEEDLKELNKMLAKANIYK